MSIIEAIAIFSLPSRISIVSRKKFYEKYVQTFLRDKKFRHEESTAPTNECHLMSSLNESDKYLSRPIVF